MSIKGSYVFETIKQLHRERERLHFNHIVQRDYVWKDEAKSLFIHSLLHGYPYPPVYALIDDKDHLWFLDGKQRMDGAVFDFLDGKYALTRNTPEFNGVKLGGKKFEDLPEDFKDTIYGANFQIFTYRNLTEIEIRELFSRLNNSVPLSKFEKVRIWVPRAISEIVRDIKNSPFFKVAVNIADPARKRFIDEESIFQILLVMRNGKEAIDLQTGRVRAMIQDMNETKIDAKLVNEVLGTIQYLSAALTHRVNELKKVHVMPVFVTATYAAAEQLPPEQFAYWLETFFDRNGGHASSYGYASLVGSASKQNVERRLRAIKKDYDTFKDAQPKKKAANLR